MNNWLSIICLAMATFYCQAQLALESTIKAVTVYNDRAAVSRTARTELAAGEQELVFKDLPYSVDNNSIQLNIKATAPITILDITVSSHNLVGDANQRLQAIENEIKALQKLLAQLTDQESLLSEQNNYIKHIQQSVVGLSEEANRPSLEQIQQVMAFSNSSLAQLSEEAHQLAIKKEQLQSQLRVLETNRSPLLQKINSQVKDVTVKVNLPKAETVTAELTYVTYGARWTPLYDARFNSKEQKLSINYLANVSQQTGEDWKNVKLTLSTAKPSFSGTIPELSPWRVAQYNNIPKNMSGRMMMKKELASSNIVKLSRRDIAKPTPMPIASISASLTNTAFIIAEPTTLLSGNHQQKVMINSLENLQPELTYETVPRLKEAAILRATAKNNSNYPLLAGPLNIFMDGRFITRGNLDITMLTDQLKVNLGVDEAINIVFKEVKQFTEKTGFTNSGERVTYDYLITAQNNKNIPVKLVISDHIPVSQNEKINVKLLSPNHIQPDKEGKINWDITLKPMEKREIPVKFTVDYPVNTHVIGL